jgi:NTE family protein
MTTATPPSGTGPVPSSTLEQYAPKPERKGIGLCLSGGGFRASLFHLGALRRLNDLNLLGSLRTISSVSGGSIVAAHIASVIPWPLTGPLDDWNERVVRPFLAFTRQDIRTGPVLNRLWPWNWLRSSTAVETIAQIYEQRLTKLKLQELPKQPNFVLCATDMAFGDNWVFERNRMGGYLPGYIEPVPPAWPLARAVAASSCFPPIFNPLPIRFSPAAFAGGKLPPGPERDKPLEDLRLTDGGVYDNLGLEPVWKNHAQVLVSDGGALFDFRSDQNILWRLQRYVAINGVQALYLRKRWLIANFLNNVMQGTYWGIGSARASYDSQDATGYSKDLARKYIAKIRTDLDAFSEAEAAILENHGYLLADAALQQHLPDLLPDPVPPLAPPHPEWLEARKVVAALADSGKRRLFRR